MMHGAHIGGQRAGGFLELVRGVDPGRVLLVGVDVAKATWFVVASNLLGDVVLDGVRLRADRAGLAELERLILVTRARLDAGVVVVGVEAAGHHHQTLTGHLGDRAELVVRLLNPGQVAAVRKQQGNRRRKTDWLDAAAICELLARGEGSPVHTDASAASALRPLWSGRKDLVDARGRLRQQAGALLDCLWPGLSAKDKQAGVTPVGSDPFRTKAGRVVVGLLAAGWTPASFAAAGVSDLRATFAVGGCRLSRPLAGRLITRAAAALPAHPAATAGKAATLAGLLGALAALDGEIARLEAEMAPLLARTQGAKLCQIRGVATVAAAGFIAFVGRAERWAEWSKVWRAAGLDPARSQSGAKDTSLGISRERSAWGRRAILDLAASVCRQPGRWGDGYRARVHHHKHPKVALAATGNQIGRTCLASWPPAPTTTPTTRPSAPSGGRPARERRVVQQPREGTRVASGGRSDAVPAMRLDLEVSLAPALGPLLQTANVASCGQTADANPSACGRERGLGGTSATTTTMTYPAATQRPSQPCPLNGLDGCYGELTERLGRSLGGPAAGLSAASLMQGGPPILPVVVDVMLADPELGLRPSNRL